MHFSASWEMPDHQRQNLKVTAYDPIKYFMDNTNIILLIWIEDSFRQEMMNYANHSNITIFIRNIQ